MSREVLPVAIDHDENGIQVQWQQAATVRRHRGNLDDLEVVRGLDSGNHWPDGRAAADQLRDCLRPLRDQVRACRRPLLVVLRIGALGDVELHDQPWELAFADLPGFGESLEVVRTNAFDVTAPALIDQPTTRIVASSPLFDDGGGLAQFHAAGHARILRDALPWPDAKVVTDVIEHDLGAEDLLVFDGHTDEHGERRQVLRFPMPRPETRAAVAAAGLVSGRRVLVAWACNSRWLLQATRGADMLAAALVLNRQVSPESAARALPHFLAWWTATGDVVRALSRLRQAFGRGDECAAPVLWLGDTAQVHWFRRTAECEFPAAVWTGLSDSQCGDIPIGAMLFPHGGTGREGLERALDHEAGGGNRVLVPAPRRHDMEARLLRVCRTPVGWREIQARARLQARVTRAPVDEQRAEYIAECAKAAGVDTAAAVSLEAARWYCNQVGGRLLRGAEYEYLAIGPQEPNRASALALPGTRAREIGHRDHSARFPSAGVFPIIELWSEEEWLDDGDAQWLVGGKPAVGGPHRPRSPARCLPQVRARPGADTRAAFRVVWAG